MERRERGNGERGVGGGVRVVGHDAGAAGLEGGIWRRRRRRRRRRKRRRRRRRRRREKVTIREITCEKNHSKPKTPSKH
jgi:hypothetical protein